MLGEHIESGEIVIHDGLLLMNGERAQWPPRDIDGAPVRIGSRVYGVRDSYNFQDEHEFTVGSLRLQYQGGSLGWVACAYDDDERYFEAWAEDCKVLDGVPQ